MPSFERNLLTQRHQITSLITRDSMLSYGENLESLSDWTWFGTGSWRTDRQTDRRTDRIAIANARSAVFSGTTVAVKNALCAVVWCYIDGGIETPDLQQLTIKFVNDTSKIWYQPDLTRDGGKAVFYCVGVSVHTIVKMLLFYNLLITLIFTAPVQLRFVLVSYQETCFKTIGRF